MSHSSNLRAHQADPRPTYPLVLDGQGIPSSTSAHVLHTAVIDAQTALGSALLMACHQAFMQEFHSLSADDQSSCNVQISSVPSPESLIELPKSYPSNAIVANIHLYLIQLLRYVRHNPLGPAGPSEPIDHEVGILAFSTGMFAAVVIASSRTVPDFITNAVEVFRALFWLGLRVHLQTLKTAEASITPETSTLNGTPLSSWSLVLFGSTRSEVQDAVDLSNAQPTSQGRPSVYLTAVTHPTCISVSGRPEALEVFKANYLPSTTSSTRSAAIYSLYHSSELESVKIDVMNDLSRRNIRFPLRTTLQRGIRSTITGDMIPRTDNESRSLAEEVMDMTLLHPVNYDSVLSAIQGEFASEGALRMPLINLGPGNVLWRSTSRALPSIHFDLVDWSSSVAHLSTTALTSPPAVPDHAPARESIAVVGMAVKFPGAEDAAGLWRILEKGLNTVSEIPSSRFNVSEYISGVHGAKRSIKTRYGNFLDDIATFDNTFFRVSPREARSMDPQQRILLEVSYHALENAGYVPKATPSFNPDTFATFVGVNANDYVQNLRHDVDVYYSTGTLQAFLAGRISYTFGFCGPSMVIDTACSASMVAIYQACRSLTNGDCNAAIAGGVNLISSPDTYLGLDRAHFLSATGQCKPWDASADGYCRSEGSGMFVLKRLSNALAENDRILGVIRGVEVNQSANAESITQPHIPTQIQLFKKLLSSAGVEPHQLNVVEAHGTGTKVGDPIEIESIRSVFAKNRSQDNLLHLSSIKANIGHAEAASGAASLAKLLLMMRHRTIPAVISLKQLNPNIRNPISDGIVIDTKAVPWSSSHTGGRLALLNNFGASGSNAALILQEAPSRTAQPTATVGIPFIVGISCETEAAVEKQRSAYVKHIERHVHDLPSLSDFAYSATARRRTFRYRLAGRGATKEEMCASLRQAQITEVQEDRGKLVVVFSGQGGQYMGMGSGLYRSLPAFRRTIDICHEKLISWGYHGIREIITQSDGHLDGDIQAFQCAVFVLECALADIWQTWGIKPDAVAGHSLGEYAALVTAGVLTLEDGLKLVAGRAQLMGDNCPRDDTGMLAIRLSPVRLEEIISKDSRYEHLSIACYNSCNDGVVAGPLSQLGLLRQSLVDLGHKCTQVNVPFGYHTKAMDVILEDVTVLASTVKLSPPSLPMVSNVLGKVVRPGDTSIFVSEYFARHCGQPVRFEQGISDLMSQEDFAMVSMWLEIGPHPTTLPMLRSIPATSHQAKYLPSLRKNTGDWTTLCASLCDVYCSPQTADWRAIFSSLVPGAGLIDLPDYPFEKNRFWVDFFEEKHTDLSVQRSPTASSPRFSLIDTCVQWPSGDSKSAVFETSIDKLSRLISGHKVSGYGLCPASVHIEIASASVQLMLEHLGQMRPELVISLSQLAISNPLVYTSDTSRTVRIEVIPSPPSGKHAGKFHISSYVSDATKAQVHCSGCFDTSLQTVISLKLSQSSTMIERRKETVIRGSSFKPPETLYTRTMYEVIFSRIVSYSPDYQTMKSITIDQNGVDAYAVMQLHPDTLPGTYVVHPIFMDTLLHIAGFAINCNAGPNEAYICSQVDKVKSLPKLINPRAEYGIYCNIGFLSETLAIADAYAFEQRDSELLVVAHVKRMHFRKLRLSGFVSILSSADGQNVSFPSTKSKIVSVPRSQPKAPRLDTHVVRPSKDGISAERIKEVLASVLDVHAGDLSEDQDLERLGMDSLMFIEVQGSLRSVLNVTIPTDNLVTCRTVGDILTSIVPTSPAVAQTPGVQSRSESTLHVSDNDADGSELLTQIKEIMAAVLGIPSNNLDEDQNLERLGMDSLMSIEAHHALCSRMTLELPSDVFMTYKTIRELHTIIFPSNQATIIPEIPSPGLIKTREPITILETNANPVKLQDSPAPASSSLFLIHDGSGVIYHYSRLASLGLPVWGIHNPKFATGGKWDGGLQSMAAHYAGVIKSVVRTGSSCVIGGWSIGGVIAFEVARQLVASGVDVPGIVLIDSPHPRTVTALPEDVIEAAFPKDSPSRTKQLARTQMLLATKYLVEYDPDLSPAKDALPPKAVMLRCREPFPIADTSFNYDPFLIDRTDPSTMVAEWERVLGYSVPVLDIPGNHFEPFDSGHIEDVSQRLAEALSLILATH